MGEKDEELGFTTKVITEGKGNFRGTDATSVQPPERFTPNNIMFWNEDWKRLEGVKEGNGIRTKAKRWLLEKCIDYGEKKGEYICKPIKNYNSTTHKMIQDINRKWICSCQFFNRVCTLSGNEHSLCSHLLALKLQKQIFESEKNG